MVMFNSYVKVPGWSWLFSGAGTDSQLHIFRAQTELATSCQAQLLLPAFVTVKLLFRSMIYEKWSFQHFQICVCHFMPNNERLMIPTDYTRGLFKQNHKCIQLLHPNFPSCFESYTPTEFVFDQDFWFVSCKLHPNYITHIFRHIEPHCDEYWTLLNHIIIRPY